MANRKPKAGARNFSITVVPTRDALNKAIELNGYCDPTKCWHFVAIFAVLELLEPGARHMVKVDAGHVKVNYCGYKYIADTPVFVKRSLMLFDLGRYDEVVVRRYILRFRRLYKITKMTRERKDQINAARNARIAAGSDERQRRYSCIRKRVEGFSGIV